jgi:hypothetical protein
MPNNSGIDVPLDRMKVNVKAAVDRRYWAAFFGVTEDRLVEAVKEARSNHIYLVRRKLEASNPLVLSTPAERGRET